MDGKQLHSEIVKLHHMIDDLYERAPLSKANSNLYQIIDEQYSKILTELIAKGVFQDEWNRCYHNGKNLW